MRPADNYHREVFIMRFGKFGMAAFAAMVAASVSACGGDVPSDSAVVTAFKAKAIEQTKAMGGRLGGQSGKDMVEKARHDIESADITVGQKTRKDDGSVSVVLSVATPGGAKTFPLTFLKGKDGWVPSEN